MTDVADSRAADQAVARLGPEAGLFPQLDPVLFSRSLRRALGAAARNPFGVARCMTSALGDTVRAATAAAARVAGVPAAGPVATPKDSRFADPAWEHNPAFFLLRQAYGIAGEFVAELIETGDVDPTAAAKAGVYSRLIVDALAPTNFFATNPTALKRAFDTGGKSVARGARNFLDDVLHNRGMPQQVDSSGFRVGDELAATPGAVVFRNNLMELIQYEPRTETVHEVPLLCSPPWINKYYVMDLAPGRSFIEWAVDHGHTVYAISYRNPDESMRDTSLDDYLIDGPSMALDVIREITGADKVNVVGLCLGGVMTAILAAYLHEKGNDRIASVTLLNTLLDYEEPGALGVFTDTGTIERLERKMAKRGYLEGSEMRGTFDILRANDLIFNYVVSNWLMGEKPPAFDILSWNSDSTRMPAKMHSFYLRSFYLANELARGELEIVGTRISLADVAQDVFLVSAVNDHIAPWTAAYAATQLLGGEVDLILSSAGHIAGIVNPPTPKAHYWRNDHYPPDPKDWLASATRHQGSWWEPWAEWIAERSGEQVKPPSLGSPAHPPLEEAPGTYVHG